MRQRALGLDEDLSEEFAHFHIRAFREGEAGR
jgi:hypothetical protein